MDASIGLKVWSWALTHAGSSSSSPSQYSSSYPPLPYARTRRSLSPCPVSRSSNRRARTVKGSPRGGHDRCSPARATVAARWNPPLAWGGRAAAPHDETNRRQSPSIVRNPVAGMQPKCVMRSRLGRALATTRQNIFSKHILSQFRPPLLPLEKRSWWSATSLHSATSEMI